MNRKEAIEGIELRQGWLDGGIIQYCAEGGSWIESNNQDNPTFINLEGGQFRIKPKPKPITRPWTMAECPLEIEVKNRDSGITFTLKYVNHRGAWIVSRHGSGFASFRELLDSYVRLGVTGDGSPCGITEDDQ